MATLFNTRISDTYQGLIKTLDNGVLGAALTQLSDGSGNGTGVFLNTSGDLEATGIVSFGSLKDIGENITISKFVDAADGLINNDNDTTIPTSAAIIDYVAGQVTLSDLDFSGDGGTTGSVDLDSQVFNVLGTANQITTSGSGQTLTIGLPTNVTIGTLTATTFFGDLSGTINTATTAVTQPLGDNSTKIATTAFVDRVITAQDLDFQGTTGIGSVDLDSQVLIIKGTTNEITTVGGAQTLTIGLPSSITTNLVGNVTGNVTGDLTGNADTATAWVNGRTITLTGEATGITPSIDGTTSVSAALTLTNSAVIGKVLTGLQSPAGATILATDSMLLAFGKLQSQINGIAEGLQFQGSWNASTNTPTLTSGVGTQGHYYIVSVAGSTNLDGITDWEVGDWAIYSTTSVWQRLDQTGVQGTGTTGNLTKWATGSTISDSIVSESGTALTVTGSLTTTLATTVSGNLTVGTDSLIVNSVSDAVSMAGILTVASPVINTGISGSAVLDDDTFATANATTVATTESIKAYIDSNTGSGTAGTIPKFATGGESLEDSIITESASAITVSGDVKVNEVNPLIFVDSTSTNKASGIIASESGTNKWAIGTNFGSSDNSFNIYNYTAESRYLTIASGGTATFNNGTSLELLELKTSRTDANYGIDLYHSDSVRYGRIGGTGSSPLSGASLGDLVIRGEGEVIIASGGNNRRLTISSAGNVNIKSVRTDGIVNIQAKDTNAYGGLNVSSFGNDNTWLSMTHDGTRGIIGQTYGSGGGYTPIVLRTSDQDRLTIASDGKITQDISRTGFAMEVVNTADASEGLLIKAADNDTDLDILDCQSSVGGTFTSKFKVRKSGEIISTKGIEFQGNSLGANQTGVASSGSGGDLRFYTNGSQRVTIKSGGAISLENANTSVIGRPFTSGVVSCCNTQITIPINAAGGDQSVGFIAVSCVPNTVGASGAVALFTHFHTQGSNGYTELENHPEGGITIARSGGNIVITNTSSSNANYVIKVLNLTDFASTIAGT